MWEWRTYYERDFRKELSTILNFDGLNAEERTDYYYDFGLEQFGLKERLSSSVESLPKLELKIRYDIASNGAEYWYKVLSKEFPALRSSHLPMFQIEDVLQEEIDKDGEYASDIEYFLTTLKPNVEITEVKKKRWEQEFEFNGELVEAEFVELEVNGHMIYGFSMECEDLEVIDAIIEEFGIDSYQMQGGYPTLIKAMNHLLINYPLLR